MILVGANMGIPIMTIEHMLVCMMREIPLIIVFTKIDMAPKEVFQDNLNKMHKKLKAVKKQPYNVTCLEDIIKIRTKVSSNIIVPIIAISNKTGYNLDLLKQLFNLIPSRLNQNSKDESQSQSGVSPSADLQSKKDSENVLMFCQNIYQV